MIFTSFQNKIILSPAKLNLSLKIGEFDIKKSLHHIDSHIVAINFFETLKLSGKIVDNASQLNIKIIPHEQMCLTNEESTMFRAIELWCKYKNVGINITINHDDNVPCQKGLGIASSNAGCVILFLEECAKQCKIRPLGKEQIKDLSLKIGSDVAFFTLGKNNAIVSGCGEIIKPMDEEKKRNFILHIPALASQTKTAFKELYKDGEKIYNEFVQIPKNHQYWQELCKKTGNNKWKLTGSGSAFFLESNDTEILKVCKKIIGSKNLIVKQI